MNYFCLHDHFFCIFKIISIFCGLDVHSYLHLFVSSFYMLVAHSFEVLCLIICTYASFQVFIHILSTCSPCCFSFYDTFFISSLCFSITIDSLALTINVHIVLSIYLPLAWFFLCVVYLFASLLYIFLFLLMSIVIFVGLLSICLHVIFF
jgi:hypothetical protein